MYTSSEKENLFKLTIPQKNASKFTISIEKENSCSFSFSISFQAIPHFYLMNALVYVDIDQAFIKGKMKVARNEK